MGWGLTINNVFLSKVSRDGLHTEKEEIEQMLEMYKNELIALAAYTGEKYFDGDQEWGLVDHVSRRVPEIMNEVCEYSWKLFLIDHAIDCPEDVTPDG